MERRPPIIAQDPERTTQVTWRPRFGLRSLLYAVLLIAFYLPIVQHRQWLLFLWSLGTVTTSGVFLRLTRGSALPSALTGSMVINLPFLPFLLWTVRFDPTTIPLALHFCILLGSQGFGIGGGIYAIHTRRRVLGWATLVAMAVSTGAFFNLISDPLNYRKNFW